jgi:2'-5' RNA ligase
MMRAFIAVEIEVFSGIQDFVRDLKGCPARLKVVEPENMHITLRFLGDISEKKAADLSDALKILEKEPAFEFRVCSAGAFPNVKNPKVVWVGIEEDGRLSELQRKVEDVCEGLGLGREKREFSPHLTVARVKDRHPVGIRPVIERYRDAEFGTVRVNEIKLKKSTLTPEGPVYEDIAVFSLGRD